MKSLRFWYENKYYSAVRLSVRESKHSFMLNIFRFNTVYPDSIRCLPASLRLGPGGPRCPILNTLSLVHTVPVFSPGGATMWPREPGPHRSDAGKHRIESGYTFLNRNSPGSTWWFQSF